MSQEIVYKEIHQNNNKENLFIKSDHKIVLKQSKSWRYLLSIMNIKSFLVQVFLPVGFPHSVHPDYIPYQIWDTIQAFASTILTTLTTHSILHGIGVGESSATPLAAAISWILKDGTGMIGRILFAWWNGNKLDAQSKKWRLFADILNDFAMGIEIILPYFPSYCITTILCLSTGMKSIVGIAGGATRAALTQHQALVNNLADVLAKDSSQETFVNLIASFVGIFILSTVPTTLFIYLYFILVAVHIYANYSAVRALRLNSLNEDRLALILNHYMIDGIILNTETINKEESLFLFQKSTKKMCGFDIKLGISLSKVLNQEDINSVKYLSKLINHFRHKKYLIIPSINKETIYIALNKHVEQSDILQAYFIGYLYGLILNLRLKRNCKIIKKGPLAKIYSRTQIQNNNSNEDELIWQIVISTDLIISQEFNWWFNLLQKSKWISERNLLPIENWRANWEY